MNLTKLLVSKKTRLKNSLHKLHGYTTDWLITFWGEPWVHSPAFTSFTSSIWGVWSLWNLREGRKIHANQLCINYLQAREACEGWFATFFESWPISIEWSIVLVVLITLSTENMLSKQAEKARMASKLPANKPLSLLLMIWNMRLEIRFHCGRLAFCIEMYFQLYIGRKGTTNSAPTWCRIWCKPWGIHQVSQASYPLD